MAWRTNRKLADEFGIERDSIADVERAGRDVLRETRQSGIRPLLARVALRYIDWGARMDVDTFLTQEEFRQTVDDQVMDRRMELAIVSEKVRIGANAIGSVAMKCAMVAGQLLEFMMPTAERMLLLFNTQYKS